MKPMSVHRPTDFSVEPLACQTQSVRRLSEGLRRIFDGRRHLIGLSRRQQADNTQQQNSSQRFPKQQRVALDQGFERPVGKSIARLAEIGHKRRQRVIAFGGINTDSLA